MRAWLLTGYGDIRTHLEMRSVEPPRPGAEEVCIDIHASSINPIDYKLIRGELRAVQRLHFPSPLGFDVAGTISAIGSGVDRWQLGDRVYARSDRRRLGAFAEQLVLPQGWVAAMPAGLDFAEAASLPLVALTTWQGLVERADIQRGQRILIHAGSGGVGTFALQFARDLGLEVWTTCSSRNEDFVRALGADEVICYDREDYRRRSERFDVVYDLLGGEHTAAAFDLLKPGGCVVSIAGPPDRAFADQIAAAWWLRAAIALKAGPLWRMAERRGFRYFRFLTEPDGVALARIAERVEAGAIRAVIDSRFRFEELPAALERCAEGRARGKVVVEVDRSAG